MALLRPKDPDRAARALAVMALVSCAGCMLIDVFRDDERGLVFSHRVHVIDEELACINCHETASVETDPGMPPIDVCGFCHDQLDAEKPPERRIEVLYDADEDFLAARLSALGHEVVFDHLQHVEAVGDCGACHVDIEENEVVDEHVRVLMDDCMACHADRTQPNECSTCHSVIERTWMPESHHQSWRKRHGRVCRRANPGPIDQCFLCHQESTCAACHQVVAPENHNAFWRLRGHAIVARVDRQNCAACHQPFSCDRCHQEVLPLSHSGMWGATRNTHCLTCHFPLPATGCLTCHKATPSHALGPPKPGWHTPTMNCRQCHGATLPLSHVDNGSNCNLCHP